VQGPLTDWRAAGAGAAAAAGVGAGAGAGGGRGTDADGEEARTGKLAGTTEAAAAAEEMGGVATGKQAEAADPHWPTDGSSARLSQSAAAAAVVAAGDVTDETPTRGFLGWLGRVIVPGASPPSSPAPVLQEAAAATGAGEDETGAPDPRP
jgi:hypothetical protein